MAKVEQVIVPEPGFYYHFLRLEAEAEGRTHEGTLALMPRKDDQI